MTSWEGLLQLEGARAEFREAGLATVDANGDGPGWDGQCPACFRSLKARLAEGRLEFDCRGDCTFSRIADALYTRPRDLARAAEEEREDEVVVVPTPKERTTTTPEGRYSGRRVDLHALLAQPPRPIPWRVHDVVADGTLTIISGESGSGKSCLAEGLCDGVASGHTVAGLLCAKGPALYVDGEMGPPMFVERLRKKAGGIAPDFHYIDAMGLDISKPDDLAWLEGEIEATGVKLVVIDSLRRLVPSKAENDSDDMAPVVAALAKLARDTDAAIILIHHKGDGEKFFRGSSAIKDQCDALFALLRDPEDEDAPRRLRCRGGKGKMRYAPEPPDVFLRISLEDGGVVEADEPTDAPPMPVREAVKGAIVANLPARTKTAVAAAVGRGLNDRTFSDAWKELEAAGTIMHEAGGWVVVAAPAVGEATTTSTLRLVECTSGVQGVE
jgi:hypothetical protein